MVYCQNCGAQISEKAPICIKCGVATSAVGAYEETDLSENRTINMLIPIGVPAVAFIAGYLGVFSIVESVLTFCGMLQCLPFCGAVSLVAGIPAFVYVKSGAKKGLLRTLFGVIAGALSIIIWLLKS